MTVARPHRSSSARTAPLFLIALLVLQVQFAPRALAAGGDLDPSFGGDGRVIGPADLGGNAVVVQSDGRIIVAGSATNDLGHPAFGMTRFDADGALDASFGDDGTVTTTFRSGPRCFEYATAVVVQNDGKIMAVGLSYCARSRFAVVRYDADGTLDAGFGGDGKVLTSVGDPNLCSSDAAAAALQPDGKLVAVGQVRCSQGATGLRTGFAVARYGTHGALDTSFSGDGKAITIFGPASDSDRASGVAVQPDGRIVAAGTAAEGLDDERFALARYRPHGAPDTSFGGNGKVRTSFEGPRCGARGHADGLALQGDGRIVVAGVAYCAARVGDIPHPRWALTRYDTDGSLDTTFGGDGRVVMVFQRDSCGDEPYGGVAIQSDQKIVAGGTTGCFSRFRFTLARFRQHGGLDTTFGGDGKVVTAFARGTGCGEQAHDVAIQADQRIVAAGSSDCLHPSRFVMARYLPD
jgi:uncharacterized delta-60 repeat protein